MFDELIKELTKEFVAKEPRGRPRSGDLKTSFEYAVGFLIGELWRNALSYPPSESSINLRRGYYSEPPRYRDEDLTYRPVKAAFDSMVNCRMIEVTTAGYYRNNVGVEELTRFIPTDRLLEKFENLEGHPAFQLQSGTQSDIIILRNKIDDRWQDVDYDDTPKTERFRSSLNKINDCCLKHWADVRIEDTEVAKLTALIRQDADKQPIDLSKRTLARIFTNGSFEEGGRFCRGWWQNIPSEYRKFITIDEAVTTEYDFSQLSPHMLYFAYNHKLGEVDAFDRVLDGEHRDVVKQAFNAMVQANSPLDQKPHKINMDGMEMEWRELRQRILDAHKPIHALFFDGIGHKLQFKDSSVAGNVMLQFAKQNQVTLPIHDSFIMREGFAGDLEEAMRRAFYDEFQADIPIKKEVIIERIPLFDEQGDPRTDAITRDDRKHSQWYNRNTLWLYSQGQHS